MGRGDAITQRSFFACKNVNLSSDIKYIALSTKGRPRAASGHGRPPQTLTMVPASILSVPVLWRALYYEVNGHAGRMPDGITGIRDVNSPCEAFVLVEGDGRPDGLGQAWRPRELAKAPQPARAAHRP